MVLFRNASVVRVLHADPAWKNHSWSSGPQSLEIGSHDGSGFIVAPGLRRAKRQQGSSFTSLVLAAHSVLQVEVFRHAEESLADPLDQALGDQSPITIKNVVNFVIV